MNIRRWEFTDLAAIAELEKACFADAWAEKTRCLRRSFPGMALF